MRHDNGGVVRLARELSPGAEPTIRTSVRLVPQGGAGRDSIEIDHLRSGRPRQSNPPRRRAQWSRFAASSLAVEVVLGLAVVGWAMANGQTVLALVALGWALTQTVGTAVGRCGRSIASVAGTFKRAQVAALAVLALVATGALVQAEAAWFLGLVGVSVGLRGLAALMQRRTQEAPRTMVVGQAQHLPAAVVNMSDGSTEVGTYSVSETDGLTRGKHLHRTILEFAPQRVVVMTDALNSQELQELSWAVEDYDIDVVLSITAGALSTRRLDLVNEPDVQGLRLTPRSGLLGDHVLGLAHRVGAALLLVVLAPVMLTVAVLVRLDSQGPALFVQNRVGRRGTEFPMFKFRTMRVDAEEMLAQLQAQNESEGGVLFKMKSDPRITRIGRILRATSLDELPQLFNVVRGEMSLIGPRPALPREVAAYDHRALRRLAVRPGLTGLWQVSGRSNLSFEDAVRLDIDYVDNWSLRREALIAVRTVGAVVRREGAY